jgi:hypothetical protein
MIYRQDQDRPFSGHMVEIYTVGGSPDQEPNPSEFVVFFGPREEKVLCEQRALGGAFASEWYQSEKISLLSVAEKKRKFHHAAEERKTITRSRG